MFKTIRITMTETTDGKTKDVPLDEKQQKEMAKKVDRAMSRMDQAFDRMNDAFDKMNDVFDSIRF